MLSTVVRAGVPALKFTCEPVFDRRGYYRSPVTLASYRRGRVPANKGRKFPPEVLTPDEVYALIRECGRGPAGIRNRALIMLMWRAGLRVAEALALERKDIDFDRGWITVLHGKGDKRRAVGIDPAALPTLIAWDRRRAKLGLHGPHKWICVIGGPTIGEPVHDAYVRDLLKRLAVKAGVEKRVHPHGLRHSFAAHLGEQVPPHVVQRMLGHASLAVTVRYLDHLSPSQAIESMQAVSWPGPSSRRSAASSRR